MKRITILAMTILGMALNVNAQSTLSLNDAISKALVSNLNMQVAQQATQVAENNVTKGNAGMLPTVTAGAGANSSVTNTRLEFAGNQPAIDQNGALSSTISANVSANYTLFNGFVATNTYERLSRQSELAKAQEQVQVETVLMQVVQAYYNTLTLQNNLEVAEKSLEISQQRYERAKLRVEFGAANKITMLNAEVDLQNDSITLVNLEQQLSNAKASLMYLMGESDSDQEYVLNEGIALNESLSLNALKQKAIDQNAELQQARAQKAVAEKDIDISKAYLYPRVSVSSSYSYSTNQNDASFILSNRSNGLNGGLNVSYNIYDGGQNKIREENAEIQLESAVLQEMNAKQRLSTEINNAYSTYENSIAVYKLRASSLKVNERNFERSQELYKTGQITGTEFREAQLNLLDAEIQLNLALISAKNAEMELLRLSGELLSEQSM